MICPLMVNGLLSIGTSETNDIEGVKKCIECLKEKCAWWFAGKCAIVIIAQR